MRTGASNISNSKFVALTNTMSGLIVMLQLAATSVGNRHAAMDVLWLFNFIHESDRIILSRDATFPLLIRQQVVSPDLKLASPFTWSNLSRWTNK